jgi:hypothetical protein
MRLMIINVLLGLVDVDSFFRLGGRAGWRPSGVEGPAARPLPVIFADAF